MIFYEIFFAFSCELKQHLLFFPEIRKSLFKFTGFEYDREWFYYLLSHSFNILMDTL